MEARTFQEILEESGYETRSYSGRGMYGKECLAVVLDRDSTLGEFISEVLETLTWAVRGDNEIAEEELCICSDAFRSMKEDSMGLGIVLYFTKVSYKES